MGWLEHYTFARQGPVDSAMTVRANARKSCMQFNERYHAPYNAVIQWPAKEVRKNGNNLELHLNQKGQSPQSLAAWALA